MGYQSRVEARTRGRKFTRVLSTFVILAGLLIAGYYAFSTTVSDGAYKIYVGGKGYENMDAIVKGPRGLQVGYYEDQPGYSRATGKEKKHKTQNPNGGTPLNESLTDPRTGITYKSGIDYMMSIGSNHEKSVQTTVEDNGAGGYANGDEFLASKFFLKNGLEPDPLTGDDGIIHYAIKIEVTSNARNALSAARFGLIKVKDQEKIYNFEDLKYDNSVFDMKVFAQPKMETLENGDSLIYQGDEEDSQEYVSSTVTGEYTNTPGTKLLKNPNKGKENEDWKCINLHYTHVKDDTYMWVYDSLIHETDESQQVFSIQPGDNIPYVISAWYEASDPNHNNSIMGGYISFQVTFYDVEQS